MRRIIIILSYAISSLFAQSDTIRYANGNVFMGDTTTHKGVLFTPQGGIYKGSIVGGKAEGLCTYYGKGKKKNAVKYCGEFRDGQFSGKGRLDENGKVFISDFSDGVPQGKGLIFYKDGGVYHGEIQNGRPHGEGKRYNLFYIRSRHRYMYYQGIYAKGKLIDGYCYNPSQLKNRYSTVSTSVQHVENVSVESGERNYYAYAEPQKTELEIQKEYAALMSELKPFPGVKLTKAEVKFSKQISRQR